MEQCKACNLYRNALNPCLLGIGGEHAKVMFIQDCVDSVDDKQDCQFVGNSVSWLKRKLEALGIHPMEDCYYTSLVKCVYDDPDNLPNTSIRICSAYLESEIEIVNPDILVPMGNKSLKFFTGKVGITKSRGNAQELEVFGRNRIVLPMLHPKMVPKRPLYKEYITKDLATLKTLIETGLTAASGVDYRYLETLDDVRAELTRLNSSQRLVFDLETTGKSPYIDGAKIVCISLTDRAKYGVVIPLDKHDGPFSQDDLKHIYSMLRILLENPSIAKCAHNGKFDIGWLKVILGIDVSNYAFDTLLAHYIAVSEEKGTQGLKSQAWEYTDLGGYDNALDAYRSSLSDGEGLDSRFNYDRIPWNILREYCAADADCCMRLWDLYAPLIEENPKWVTLFKDIMLPGTYALRDLEINGMLFDKELSAQYIDDYAQELQRIVDRLNEYPEVLEIQKDKLELFKERQRIKMIPKKDRTEEEQQKFVAYKKYEDFHFNWSSVSQLRELLYGKLHLKTSIKTDKGDPSTSEEALEDLKQQHEIPKLLLELRKVNTLNSMFIQKLPGMSDSQGLVHSSYNMTGCVVGTSLVLTDQGLVSIADLYNTGKVVPEAQPNSHQVDLQENIVNIHRELEKTAYAVKYYYQPTIRVLTQLGVTIEGTYNHPIIVNAYDRVSLHNCRDKKEIFSTSSYRLWKRLDNITTDSLIAIAYDTQVFGNYRAKMPKFYEESTGYLTTDLALFLGIYKAIGKYKDNTVLLNSQNEQIIRIICELSIKLFNRVAIIKHNHIIISDFFWSEQLELTHFGIPNFILRAPKAEQIAYLKGLFVSGFLYEVKFCPVFSITRDNLSVLRTIQLMLLNLGIVSVVYNEPKVSRKSYRYNVVRYYLRIIGQDFERFLRNIGTIVPYTLSNVNYKQRTLTHYVDEATKTIWVKVSAFKRSNNTVFDLNVPNSHSFIVNGFISHNTVTGRLSSENPNMQQMPRKSPENPLLFQYHHEPKSLFVSRFGDNGVIMNADYCLAGDTQIALIDDEHDTIKSICERVTRGEELYTYSINPKSKEIVVSRILGGQKTRINEPTLKITLNNSKSIVCSYNHKFLLKSGKYKEARELAVGTHLMGFGVTYIVMSIKSDVQQDLYDIEVENYSNFSLTAGIFVHNSALEMRVAAVISNDKKMAQAFLSGVDIHKANAAFMWHVPIEEVTKDLRTKSKSLGFGILYGKSGVTFARDLYYDPKGQIEGRTADWNEAKRQGFEIVDHFLGTFKGIKRWLEKTKEFAYDNGYVETMFGRRRRLPNLKSKIPDIRADAERQAINAPIQGTGSDFTMLSLIKISEYLKQANLRSQIIATVHDSIVFDVYLPELPTVAKAVKDIMESVHKPYINTVIPIVAELELGKNYGATFEIELDKVVNISTQTDFNAWKEEQYRTKYKKEIDFFIKQGWSIPNIQSWLLSNNRPIDLL